MWSIFAEFEEKKSLHPSSVKAFAYLSIGIANLINIFRPELVILGGGVSAQKQVLTDAVKRKVEQMCFGGELGEVADIVTSELGNDAGIIGAAFLTL